MPVPATSPSAASPAPSTEAGDADAVDFIWDGNDEMDQACGDGEAELQPDGTLDGKIRFHHGDEIPFTARRWQTSSMAG